MLRSGLPYEYNLVLFSRRTFTSIYQLFRSMKNALAEINTFSWPFFEIVDRANQDEPLRSVPKTDAQSGYVSLVRE